MKSNYFLMFIILTAKTTDQKSKTSTQNFRQYMEEGEENLISDTENKDPTNNWVSVLVQNVNEIFQDSDDSMDTKEIQGDLVVDYGNITSTMVQPKQVSNLISADEAEAYVRSLLPYPHAANDVTRLTSSTVLLETLDLGASNETDSTRSIDNITTKSTKHTEKTKLIASEVDEGTTKMENYIVRRSSLVKIREKSKDIKRSCIFCNNINNEDCDDPKLKLITSVKCDHEGDMCYSQHTPFGIVIRGCFGVNNISTYVCSCHLCNNLPYSKMPYIFDSYKNWIQNVVYMGRMQSLRKSVFNDMSCLQCSGYIKDKDSAHCMEGTITELPLQACQQDEICGIKVLKAEGYIWRGCLKTPLYNYWLTLCNYDLCNVDNLKSPYDFL